MTKKFKITFLVLNKRDAGYYINRVVWLWVDLDYFEKWIWIFKHIFLCWIWIELTIQKNRIEQNPDHYSLLTTSRCEVNIPREFFTKCWLNRTFDSGTSWPLRWSRPGAFLFLTKRRLAAKLHWNPLLFYCDNTVSSFFNFLCIFVFIYKKINIL